MMQLPNWQLLQQNPIKHGRHEHIVWATKVEIGQSPFHNRPPRLGGAARYAYLATYPPGYCRAQHRYIPDDEYLKASIALLYWDMNRITTTYPEGRKVKKKDIYYQGIDFDPKNPNCCFVTRGEETVIDQMLGWQTVFVFLNPRTSKGPVTSMGDSFYEFDYSDCGELLSSGIGLPDTSGNVTTTTYHQFVKR